MGFPRSKGTLVDVDFANGAKASDGVNEYITAYSHAALVVGDVVQIIANAAGPLTKAVVTIADAACHIGVVCTAADGAGHWVKIQTRGFAEAFVEGTTDVVAGDSLKVLNGENDFKQDQSGGGFTVNTSAVAIDGQTNATPAVVSVYLTGTPCTV
jgi:hypothetical protein